MTTYERYEAALATQIKIELVERGMNQKDLAESVGVGRPAMNLYLTCKRSMPMPTLYAVADVFGLTPRELLERAEARLAR